MTEDELKRKLEDSFRCGIGYCTSVGACASRAIKVFRAAGWAPPIPSNLRAVEKVVLENDSADRMQPSLYSGHRSRVLDEPTRTITRLLTPEETNEVAEECELMHRENGQALTLISGARVILVEDNDARACDKILP
jgi:hypothetical protein